MLKERANFLRIMELFTQNVVTKLSKYGFGIRDPISGIRKKPIPDPGVKKAPDPGSATLLPLKGYEWIALHQIGDSRLLNHFLL